MNAVITGDIVQSQSVPDPGIWLNPLKEFFSNYGDTPAEWEIYRGDSFQLVLPAPDSVRASILIKSLLKKLEYKVLDVTLAIGIDSGELKAKKVSEATGDAFVYSGQLLDSLKKEKIRLGIKTPWNKFDDEFNMMFKLALVIMNSWTSNSAEVAEILFNHPRITQVEIAKKLGIAQSSVNDRIKRGAIYEIMEMEKYFRSKIKSEK